MVADSTTAITVDVAGFVGEEEAILPVEERCQMLSKSREMKEGKKRSTIIYMSWMMKKTNMLIIKNLPCVAEVVFADEVNFVEEECVVSEEEGFLQVDLLVLTTMMKCMMVMMIWMQFVRIQRITSAEEAGLEAEAIGHQCADVVAVMVTIVIHMNMSMMSRNLTMIKKKDMMKLMIQCHHDMVHHIEDEDFEVCHQEACPVGIGEEDQ